MFATSILCSLSVGLVYCLHVSRRLVGARRREVARAMVPGAIAGGVTLALCALLKEICTRQELNPAWTVCGVLSIAGFAMIFSGLALKRGIVR